MEINYQKLGFGKLRMDSYKVVQKFTNYQYCPSHAQIVLCYAVATWLLCYLIVILFYCISATLFCGMCPANLKQLVTLILFLQI